METKKEIIDFINAKNSASLNNSNTSFSSINKSKEVWWLNVPIDKFNNTVHLLLKSNTNIIWICLPKNFTQHISSKFKVRIDKNAVDLEISADKKNMYLCDLKSGGTKFDFSSYVKNYI